MNRKKSGTFFNQNSALEKTSREDSQLQPVGSPAKAIHSTHSSYKKLGEKNHLNVGNGINDPIITNRKPNINGSPNIV